MDDSQAPYRIWIAGEKTWLPGPRFSTLDLALASARALASSGDVALELPSRHWHTFAESGEHRLGPAQLAKLSVSAKGTANVLGTQNTETERRVNRSYPLSMARLRPATRPASKESSQDARTARVTATQTARVTATRTARVTATRTARVTATRTARVTATQTAKAVTTTGSHLAIGTAREGSHVVPTNERRGGERYDASLILDEPRCIISARPTSIVDLSETGLKLIVPAGVRVQVQGVVPLVFSGRHGHFDLITRICWSHNGQLGLEISDSGRNIVGRMFFRKMISRWIEREKRRARFRRK